MAGLVTAWTVVLVFAVNPTRRRTERAVSDRAQGTSGGVNRIKPTVPHGNRISLSSPALRVAPSLLSADFSKLSEQVAQVEQAGAQVLHLDVMDGHFVPNISFGAPVIRALRPLSRMFFDAHLMISEPGRYVEPFVQAGCDLITFHVEVTDHPEAVVDQVRSSGVAVGVALNPTTPVSAIESVVDAVDLVLIMSVWPGFGGQAFLPDVLGKVKELQDRLRTDQRLEIDGGIDESTIGTAAAAGADTFVAGTAVFGRADPAAAFRHLTRLAGASGEP